MSHGYLRLSCRRLPWAEHLPSALRDRRCLHYGQRLRCAPALLRRALRAAKDRHLPIDQTVERLTLRASARRRDGDEIPGTSTELWDVLGRLRPLAQLQDLKTPLILDGAPRSAILDSLDRSSETPPIARARSPDLADTVPGDE